MCQVNALKALRGHMNIVTLHKVDMDPSDPMATIVCLVFELCEAGHVGRLPTICAKENKINHPDWNPKKLLPKNTGAHTHTHGEREGQGLTCWFLCVCVCVCVCGGVCAVPTLEQLAGVMFQILNGIAYMHCKGCTPL